MTNSRLVALAQAHKVATEYWDYDGNHRQVNEDTIRAVLRSQGVAASSDEEVEQSLLQVQIAGWNRVVPPTVVTHAGQAKDLYIYVPHGAGVKVEAQLENGEIWPLAQRDNWVDPRQINGVITGQATFVLPDCLPLGWHELVVTIEGEPKTHHATLITVPTRLDPPALSRQRWGVQAQLYAVISRSGWGMGDAGDLADLAALCAGQGADFVLINPVHAGQVTSPLTPSPYLPTSRRFVDPIYIRPEIIAEFNHLSEKDLAFARKIREKAAKTVTKTRLIDRDTVWQAKLAVLEKIFQLPRTLSTQVAFTQFAAENGEDLERFALWCALSEYCGGELEPKYADIDSEAVKAVKAQLAERIEFYKWLQWIVNAQFKRAQSQAREMGMQIGVCADLAVGVHPQGADVWTLAEDFAHGVTVGAPPDMYNQKGQNWSQPPWSPRQLEESGYRPLKNMVRAVLRNAGALRLDHVMGLFRLWLIPEGCDASVGTYVYYDHEAMVGVILLEAYRAGAVVIGEDLGTVEPWVREYLEKSGIYGTTVMWFEWENGQPKPASHYRQNTFTTVNTHDLPPLLGYLELEHVDLRADLGLLTKDETLVRAEAEKERQAFLDALCSGGFGGCQPVETDKLEQLIPAFYRYIADSNSRLLGVSLVDMVGQRTTQNQPGTDKEYPNWKIPLQNSQGELVFLEDIPTVELMQKVISAVKGHADE